MVCGHCHVALDICITLVAPAMAAAAASEKSHLPCDLRVLWFFSVIVNSKPHPVSVTGKNGPSE